MQQHPGGLVDRLMGAIPNPMGVLTRGARCPNCVTPDRPANIAWCTVTTLEDRFTQRCTRCGGEWVVVLSSASPSSR